MVKPEDQEVSNPLGKQDVWHCVPRDCRHCAEGLHFYPLALITFSPMGPWAPWPIMALEFVVLCSFAVMEWDSGLV